MTAVDECYNKWQIVLRDLAKFIDSAKGLGLNLNNTKCEITVFTQDQQKSDMILREFRRVCPGISSVSTEDAELLGSPLGHTALQHALEERRERKSKTSARIFRYCLHTSRFSCSDIVLPCLS